MKPSQICNLYMEYIDIHKEVPTEILLGCSQIKEFEAFLGAKYTGFTIFNCAVIKVKNVEDLCEVSH